MAQLKIDFIRAYGKGCVGCINNETDIMLTHMNGEEFVDLFMSQEVAQQFSDELVRRLKQNKEDETTD